jgi:hypothetical protein
MLAVAEAVQIDLEEHQARAVLVAGVMQELVMVVMVLAELLI